MTHIRTLDLTIWSLAIFVAVLTSACSARKGVDLDDEEIQPVFEKYQEVLEEYRYLVEIGYAWSDTRRSLALAYEALEEKETAQALKLIDRAHKQTQLANKQYEQQYEYADVFGTPIRCATYFAELDCPDQGALYAQVDSVDDEGLTWAEEEFIELEVESTESAAFAGSAAFAVTGSTAPQDEYIVIRGDSLWKISGRQSIYGDPFRWPLIFKTNISKIKDADLIFPKQVLNIFRGFDPTEIKRAIDHARNRGAWVIEEREYTDDLYLESSN